MRSFVPLIILAVVLGAVFVFVALKKRDLAQAWPYKLRNGLLTDNERFVFERLREALPQHLVFPQVELSRVIGITAKGKGRQAWFNRINGKSLDFVICDANMHVLAAVELDDSTHESASQRERDEVKDRACASAGMTLVRWRRKTLPSPTGIRAAVLGAELSEVEALAARPVARVQTANEPGSVLNSAAALSVAD